MPTHIIDKIMLTEVGTNITTIHVEANKCWITLTDDDNPDEPFIALNKADWEAVKEFVDHRLNDNKSETNQPTVKKK